MASNVSTIIFLTTSSSATASHHHLISQFNANSSTVNGEASESQEAIGSIVLPGISIFHAFSLGTVSTIQFSASSGTNPSMYQPSSTVNGEASGLQEHVRHIFHFLSLGTVSTIKFTTSDSGSIPSIFQPSSTVNGEASGLQEHAGRSEWRGQNNNIRHIVHVLSLGTVSTIKFTTSDSGTNPSKSSYAHEISHHQPKANRSNERIFQHTSSDALVGGMGGIGKAKAKAILSSRKNLEQQANSPLVSSGPIIVQVDGAYSYRNGKASCGGVIKDHQGRCRLDAFMFHIGEGDALVAQLWGCLMGLRRAWDGGHRNVILQSDSVRAIDLITIGTNNSEFHVDAAELVQECHNMLRRDWIVEVIPCRREDNTEAVCLASIALYMTPGVHSAPLDDSNFFPFIISQLSNALANIEVKEHTAVSNQSKWKRGAFGNVYKGFNSSSAVNGEVSELQERAGRREREGKNSVPLKIDLSVIPDHEDEAKDATGISCGSDPSEFMPNDEANDATRSVPSNAQPIEVKEYPVTNQSERHRELLGKGGYGSVYKLSHRETGQICAVKEIRRGVVGKELEACLQQLSQEAKILSQLSHPNIVAYYRSEFEEENGSIYMEYASRGSIHDMLKNGRPFKEQIIQKYTKQMVSAVDYLHDSNIVHRDIKGANILVNAEGDIKLADFGLSRYVDPSSKMRSFKGTRFWMAPEIVNGDEYTKAVDIWSLGCTVLEMATARHPWDGYEWEVAKEKIGNSTDLPAIPDHLSDNAKAFIKSCLQKNPVDRATTKELLSHAFIRGC